jgi:hypothetical protein
MTVQQTRRPAGNISFVGETEERRTPAPVAIEMTVPPSYGASHRKHIETCVEDLVQDLCAKIDELRQQLKTIEDILLQSAAKSKHSLNEHVTVCIKLNDEIMHTQDIINELKAAAQNA